MPKRKNFEIYNESTGLFCDYGEYQRFTQLYSAAIKQLTTRFDILSCECETYDAHNPIHHIDSRLKSIPSIVEKLSKRGYDISAKSAIEHLNDIAGLRVVCSYIDDVYRVADMLLRQSDVVLIERKDYIQNPNYNGYRSLHLDVEIPVFFSNSTEYVTAEIQLRTVAMDFWASLEHDLRYKSEKNIPGELCKEMLACADEIAVIDAKMQEIYKKIHAL